MTDWWQLLAAGLGGGGLASVIGALLTGLWQRPKVRAEAVAMLTDSAIKQVNELQERTAEAEREATAARNEAREARDHIRVLTGQIDSLTGEVGAALATLRQWRHAILASRTVEDLARLREMVVAAPGDARNGRPDA